MREKIAEAFRVARAEGALRKVADGQYDADQILALARGEIQKSVLTDEEIISLHVKTGFLNWMPPEVAAQAQLDKVLALFQDSTSEAFVFIGHKGGGRDLPKSAAARSVLRSLVEDTRK